MNEEPRLLVLQAVYKSRAGHWLYGARSWGRGDAGELSSAETQAEDDDTDPAQVSSASPSFLPLERALIMG